jgi:hypothetical protein
MENLLANTQIHEHTLSHVKDIQHIRFAVHALLDSMQYCPNGLFYEG